MTTIAKDSPDTGDVHVDVAGSKKMPLLGRKPRDKSGTEIAKSEPAPLYVYRQLLNAAEVIKWAKGQGFTTCLPPESMHVTVLYSKAPVDWMAMGEDWSGPGDDGKFTIGPGGPRVVTRFNQGAVVLEFAGSWLRYRHDAMIERGASSDFPDYKAHVTLSYKADDVDLDKVDAYQGKLVFGPEVFEEIKAEGFDPDTVIEKSFGTFFKVSGVDQGLGLVFGWGIVCKEAGVDYYDVQKNHIPEDAMVHATTDFMKSERMAGEMHTRMGAGQVVHSFPLTTDIAKAMGVASDKTGWMIAMAPDPAMLAKFASGELTGFSIGGEHIEVNGQPLAVAA